MRNIGAAAVILDAAGRVLLVRHSYGHKNWELPGGVSEAGESAADTAVREVGEETGLGVAVERLTGVYWERDRRDAGMHHFVFACTLLDPNASPRPTSREILECGYFAEGALPRPLSDFTLRRIQDALAGRPAALVTISTRRWLE